MPLAQPRYDFASDNTAGICPVALDAINAANDERAVSYGEDEWTRRLCDRVREIFETNCDVYVVFNGTAANALSLAHLGAPFGSVLCHEHAHIYNDECGACEMFGHGAKLIPTPGASGKIDLRQIDAALQRQNKLHSHLPRLLSVTQTTELGTVYTGDEVREIAAFTRKRQLLLHMDGARFANSVAQLNCAPAELTWRAGVSALALGGTKNGLAAGELVVFFDRTQSANFDYRAKQAGQLASKMRFLSAPWLALLSDGVWLKNAAHANASARKLADAIRDAGGEIVFPVEGSAVFIRLPDENFRKLEKRGWRFYKFLQPDVYRLMCAWSTADDAIIEFARDFRECCAEVSVSV
ncbi:MAG: low specificity L-threonine aldolase [Verrucomicrobiota bacterium]|nr:low specificity L-threonine aldolase [Verrucomicrobiota bacterium]